MPRITNIDQLCNAADPVTVIGRRISLRRSGSDHVGRCPFHSGGQERSPSLHVRPERGWYCHGPCKRGGTVLGFLMEFEGLDFIEAAELLASEVGIELTYDSAPSADAQSGPRRKDLYAAVQAAAEHYAAQLSNHSYAVDYATERGLTQSVRARWQIGYAHGNSVREAADPELLHQAGILKQSKNGELHDPLAGRLIIPLHDTTGRPIAFTGRALPSNESAAKYLNTADTRIYKKGEHLYAYHAAVRKIRNYPDDTKPSPIVVEGQLNAIACHEQGIPAVAPGGSTLTERQALLLQRLHEHTRLAYDQDTAGIRATLTAATELRRIGQQVYVAELQTPPNWQGDGAPDPDELAAADHAIDYSTTDVITWAVRRVLTQPEGTGAWASQISKHILPIIHAHPDDLVRETDERRLAEITGLTIEAIQSREIAVAEQDTDQAGTDEPAEQIDTSLTPPRLLCAIALQLPLENDPNRWQLYLRPLGLPVSVLEKLSDIGRIRRVAATYQTAVTTAITRLSRVGTLDHARYLHYWATAELPGPADLTGFCRVQDAVIQNEEIRRYKNRELI